IVIHGPLHGSPEGGLSSEYPVRSPTPPPSREAGTARLLASLKAADGGRSETPDSGSRSQPRRALSLDALRGFFLVLMTFGFTIQTALLPLWMYHKQMPPPTLALVDAPGIGWRDLAYAAFIFTMAAALPITLSRRIEQGETEVSIVLAALRRFGLLFVFALLIGHANTYFIGYTQTGRALAILGFVIMFAVFVRRRADWSERTSVWISRAGWIAAILFLTLSPLTYGKTFSPARRDEIIAYLAVASLFGSLVWYFTRNNLQARLAVLAGIVALYLGARGDGWIGQWWWSSPAPWLFRPTDLGLMAVVIPGTIAGDVILRWMRTPAGPHASVTSDSSWSRSRVAALAGLGFVLTPIVVAGLYGRWVGETTQAAGVLCLLGAGLVWRPTTEHERMLRALFAWAAVWLLIGLFLEPSEGGIKKVPETLSYFFTVTGLTMMLLVAFAAIVEVLNRRKSVATLIDVGHNPMLCYVLYTVFLNSILEMIPPVRGVLRDSAGSVVLRSVISTIVVVLLVRLFTRKRIFWRT
ncbi:MAG TPA: DUF5009 domain-containing protein, partial [Gemmatimonadaceae bacterium]|nr:DUF5009 domain-containing protein [Gemmatimonadaceae bacterium]